MGGVLDALEETGLADNTLVICTTDHGIAFPRMKCHLTDAGMGVMLMIRGPGGFEGGRVIDGMVSHIDIFPTICERLGINPFIAGPGPTQPDESQEVQTTKSAPVITFEAEGLDEASFRALFNRLSTWTAEA